MKISKNCYALTGLFCTPPWDFNSGFIAGYGKTLIIDSGSNYSTAQTIYGYAKIANPGNDLLLINTERHLDHIGGNGYFSGRKVPIYGHASIKRKQNELRAMIDGLNASLPDGARKKAGEASIAFRNTVIENPDRPIVKDTLIDLDKITAHVLLTPGHTFSNLSVHCENDGVVFCGDCVVPEFIPNLEEGNSLEWKTWIESLNRLENLNIEMLVPGHGNVINGKSNIRKEITRMKDFLSKALDRGIAPTKNR